ncbi:MAG: hypothetical protein O3B47_04150 [bacterium]|nr:hypothetical protein [bacterium]
MTNCKNCQKSFEVRDKDRVFYKKFDAPEPTLCPDCRFQKRLCFRNERTFYKRKSSLSDKSIISIYNEDAKHPVYSAEEWWSDKHDALKFGQDFDFERPFFEQFQELLLKVPRIGLFNVNPTNSEFCQQAYDNKNCYLCVVLEKCEDCMYISHINDCSDCFDCSYMHYGELCYDCIDSNKLYGCIGSQSCQNSNDLLYCYDCIGCKNCTGCYGLRNKEYFIMNEAYDKEGYFEKLKSLELNKYSKFLNAKRFFDRFTQGLPHRANRNLNCDDSDGNYLINCQRAHECYDSFELQDCAYCTWIFQSRDCYDVYGLGHGELVLEGLGVEAVNHCAFNTFVSDSSDVFYSDCCFYSHNLFGCAGLKTQKYCIFNKQYSPEEYEKLRARIIEHMRKTGEWGEFFPVSVSPYAYNETAANYYYPLEKSAALAAGYRWKDPDKREYLAQTFEIPDDVQETDSSICDELLACIDCRKNYKIMPKELSFYKRQNIAVPRKCPDCRYRDRFNSRNPRFLWDRKCGKCSVSIKTTYAPEREEKIYCEECYKGVVS